MKWWQASTYYCYVHNLCIDIMFEQIWQKRELWNLCFSILNGKNDSNFHGIALQRLWKQLDATTRVIIDHISIYFFKYWTFLIYRYGYEIVYNNTFLAHFLVYNEVFKFLHKKNMVLIICVWNKDNKRQNWIWKEIKLLDILV